MTAALMRQACRPITPPAPMPLAKDLPGWRLIFAFTRNTISVQPRSAYEDLVRRRRIFGIDSILLNDPDGIRHVLSEAMAKYRRPVAVERLLAPLASTGLFLASGEGWRRQRRMLAPLFRPASIALFLPHFVAAAHSLVSRLERSATANLWAEFHDTALDAVLRSLFSLPESGPRNRIADLVNRYMTGPGQPTIFDGLAPRPDWLPWTLRDRRQFEEEWRPVVAQVVANRRAAGYDGPPRDFLDLMLLARSGDTSAPLPDREIEDQCATMIVAGHETTARLLFWTAYLLTLDPKEQECLREEARALPLDGIESLEDLRRLPRMRRVLLESLRLYPPIAYMSREAIADDVVAGERIRAGTQVWISPWVLHRHNRFWDDPWAFVPDRFDDASSPWTTLPAFIPFGAGPRICIGAAFAMAEAQVVIAALLARFRLRIEGNRSVMPRARLAIEPDIEPRFALESV